jgi:hypothetical protein
MSKVKIKTIKQTNKHIEIGTHTINQTNKKKQSLSLFDQFDMGRKAVKKSPTFLSFSAM